MNKILSIALITGLGFCSATYAKTIQLNPKETKVLANKTLWKVNATCTIQSTNRGKIKIHVLKNGGTVNGKKLSSGQGTLIPVQNNSSVSVSAESGTEINLSNVGSEKLMAACST